LSGICALRRRCNGDFAGDGKRMRELPLSKAVLA